MLTEKMIEDGMKYYKWSTIYPLITTIDSMDDFIENEFYADYEIIEDEGNQIVIKMKSGQYLITVYGDGDFCNHIAMIDKI